MFIAALFMIAKGGKQPKCLSNDEWTKHNGVYPCNEILFNNKRKQSSDTCWNIDEPQNHVKGKKSLKKNGFLSKWVHIVVFNLYGISRKDKFIDIESKSVVVLEWKGVIGWTEGIDCKQTWGNSEGARNVLKLGHGDIYQVLQICK